MTETEQCCEVCRQEGFEDCDDFLNSSEDFSDNQTPQGIWPDEEY